MLMHLSNHSVKTLSNHVHAQIIDVIRPRNTKGKPELKSKPFTSLTSYGNA